jgi:hypothetical protein
MARTFVVMKSLAAQSRMDVMPISPSGMTMKGSDSSAGGLGKHEGHTRAAAAKTKQNKTTTVQ